MATQPDLFPQPDGERPPLDVRGLMVGRPSSTKLSKAQQAFRRLVAKIEQLQRRVDSETARYEGWMKFYAAEIHPLETRVHQAQKDFIRLLYPFLRHKQIKSRRQREGLRELLVTNLQAVIAEDGELAEQDLRAIFEDLEGQTFEESEAEGLKMVSELFKEQMGVDVDFSQIRPGMPPDELRAKIEELEDQFAGQASRAGSRRERPKSKRQIDKEAREREREELRAKNVGSLYKQLAKLLHPDLEQDPARRAEKETAMKRLTTAYRDGDLHAILKLEVEWIAREQTDVARLTEEKLKLYNEVLREQVEELESMAFEVGRHPRFAPLLKYADPLLQFCGYDPQQTQRELSLRLDELARSAELLRGPQALAEVRQLIRDWIANDDWPVAWRGTPPGPGDVF